MLSIEEIDALFPQSLPDTQYWEKKYPPRVLPEGAWVTRFCPSPTGLAHIGGVYVAMIDKALARQTNGTYIIRIEDTDQAREVGGAAEQFGRAFGYFDVASDETDESGVYGPYTQSHRSSIYMSYVRQLLYEQKAYLCFASKEELEAATEEQRSMKLPTGYYGRWALWRDAPDEAVRTRLANRGSYVVRLRSPGEGAGRVSFEDVIRGTIEADANQNDIVLLKNSANALRLPTYHLAHIVDDHLMRCTIVIRGEEWIPSVPIHLQIIHALGLPRLPYAHISPLLKQEGAGKRKLSKRKDPEASVDFYIAAGYPADAILCYLRGLANARLGELPPSEALNEPIKLDECSPAGSLVDLVKAEDVSSNIIALMHSSIILRSVLAWAAEYDPELASVLLAHDDLALRALAVEREGVANPRKDLRKWADFRAVYGYFFPEIFELVTNATDERFEDVPADVIRRLCADFLRDYQSYDDADAWFAQVRAAALANGFAASVKEFKQNPSVFVGSIREASQVIRVALTGSRKSHGLHAVANVIGEAEVRRRVSAVLERSVSAV